MGKEQKIAVVSKYKLAIYLILVIFAALFVSILSLDKYPPEYTCVTPSRFERYFAHFDRYIRKGFSPEKDRIEVLMIHSYQHDNIWAERIIKGVQSVLYANFGNIDLDVEFLASREFPEVLESDVYLEHFKQKINLANYDIVIVSDNNAFEYIKRHREYLLGDKPLVFCGVNNYSSDMIEGMHDITGIAEHLDFEGTVSLAKGLFPKTKKVYFIVDRTNTGQSLKLEVQNKFSAKKNGVEYEFIDYASTKQVGDKLSSLGPDSIVVLLIWTKDENGIISYEEACEYFTAKSKVPVFGVFGFYIDHGIVGGSLALGYDQGIIAAELATQIINGVNASDIPVVHEGSTKVIFDYEKLRKFGINTSKLPHGSIIINYPENIFVEYKKEILFSIALFAFLSVVIIFLIINVYHRKSIQKQLAEKQKELKALVVELASKNEELESIIYASYHDLRSPLININGFANELADTCKEVHEKLKGKLQGIEGSEHVKQLIDERLPHEIEQLTTNANKMSLLQSSLLEVSKIGQELLDISSVNVNSLICSILESIPEIQQSKIDVYIKTLPDCMGDAKQLRRVFTNIIENAVKFRSPDRQCEIIIYGTIAGDKVMYNFEDNGIGIDRKNHSDIFRLFYRIDVGPENPGMGLGLTIAKRIVTRHNGQIKVHSEVGKGSTFTVILPLKHDPSLR